MFKFSWERFSNPGVIAGLVIIVLGFVLLCAADKLSNYLIERYDIKRNLKLIFKLSALLLVIIGSLTAVFTI